MLIEAGSLMPKALTTLPRFIRAHEEHDEMLKDYMVSKKGRWLYDAAVLEKLKDRSSSLFPATNGRARIAIARAAHERSRELAPQWGKVTYFVTFVPPECAMPLSEASNFDPNTIIRWTRSTLADCHFFGAVDAALYTNHSLSPGGSEPTVFWHVHLIVWGCDESHVRAQVDHINAETRCIIPGGSVAHYMRRTQDQTPGHLLYALKAPLKEYRILDPKQDQVRSHDHAYATSKVRKRPLRPADAVRMCKVIQGHCLLNLVFAGGKGESFKKQIEKDARLAIQREEDRKGRILGKLLVLGTSE